MNRRRTCLPLACLPSSQAGADRSQAVIASFLLVLGFQIYWAASASVSDFQGPYSAGKDIAEYIKTNKLEDKKIFATSFWSTTILPYFDKNIFDNHNNGRKPAFWLWSPRNNRIEDIETILRDQPDLIIIGRPGNLKELPGEEQSHACEMCLKSIYTE